jgi:hypothetical protein
MLLMFALLAPILILAAGIFARQEKVRHGRGNAPLEDPGKTAHSVPGV